MQTQVNVTQQQIQVLKPVVPELIVDKTVQKVGRVSHSYNSVKNLKSAIKSFNRFMLKTEVTWDSCLDNALESLDDFAGWLDNDKKKPKSIRLYCGLMKKVLNVAGAGVSKDAYSENVTLPKVRAIQDEKVDHEQIRSIILSLKHHGLKTLLMLSKDTQARPLEIVTRKVGDFKLDHDPPYFNINAEHTKSGVAKELFFTDETKEFVIQQIRNEGLQGNDFLFLNREAEELDEMDFKKCAGDKTYGWGRIFRQTLEKKLPHLNEKISGYTGKPRYKIHIYSFKKFAFTAMADAVGEVFAKSMKGDADYAQTYYKKSQKERVEDFRKVAPKLVVFSQQKDVRQNVEDEIKNLSKDDLVGVLEFLRNGKTQSNESEESSTKRLPVENHTGSFNKISKQ